MQCYYSIIFNFYFGCSWGSFLMATYQRRLTGGSITFPASHCDYCLTPLPYFCLFPILATALARGAVFFAETRFPSKCWVSKSLAGSALVNHTTNYWRTLYTSNSVDSKFS